MPNCEECGHQASSHDNPQAGADTFCSACESQIAFHRYYPSKRKGILGKIRA